MIALFKSSEHFENYALAGSMNNQQPRDGTRISQIGLIEFGVICVAVLIGVSFSTVLFIVNIVFRNFR